MGEKGKILNFPIKDINKSNNDSNGNGEIIDFGYKKKIREKDDLTSELLNSISYMIWLLEEIYNENYDIKDNNFVLAIKQLHNAINELEKFYDDVKDISISSIDEMLFKLGIMTIQSYYFVSLFNMLDNGEYMDLFGLKYYVSLVYLYVEYMNIVISDNDYDYSDFDGTIRNEEEELFEVIEDIEIRTKKDAYREILISRTEKKLGKLDNKTQVKILSELILDTVNYFISFDEDKMLEYYDKVLDRYVDSGIFDASSFEDIESKEFVLKIYKDKHKQYYASYKIVDDFIIFADKYASSQEAVNLSNKFDKLFYLIDKMRESGNTIGMSTIERTIKLIYNKIINMVDLEGNEETKLKFEEIFSDEIILNTIYMINNDLLDGKIEGINENLFNHVWILYRKININKYLSDIVRREIFSQKDIEFYSSSKYKSLVELVINDISSNGYYAGFDVEKDYIKDDFDRILNTLKKSYELENSAIKNGFNTILDDINKINYLDYTNTIRYISMLDHIFSGINLSNLKEFLESSAYLPMSVQYNNSNCISLYRNKDNSLIMDNNDYYFVSNKELNNINSIVLDSKYSDREYVYEMVINNIMDKYNIGMRMLEIRRKKRNGKR